MPTLNCESRSAISLVHGTNSGIAIGCTLVLLGYSSGYIAYRILGNAESKRNQTIIGISAAAGIVAPCYAFIFGIPELAVLRRGIAHSMKNNPQSTALVLGGICLVTAVCYHFDTIKKYGASFLSKKKTEIAVCPQESFVA